MLTCSGLQSGPSTKIRNRLTDHPIVKDSLIPIGAQALLLPVNVFPSASNCRNTPRSFHGLGSVLPEKSACESGSPGHAGIASAPSVASGGENSAPSRTFRQQLAKQRNGLTDGLQSPVESNHSYEIQSEKHQRNRSHPHESAWGVKGRRKTRHDPEQSQRSPSQPLPMLQKISR